MKTVLLMNKGDFLKNKRTSVYFEELTKINKIRLKNSIKVCTNLRFESEKLTSFNILLASLRMQGIVAIIIDVT